MSIYWLFLLWLVCVPTQALGPAPNQESDCLTAQDRSRLQKEVKLDNRIKVYDEVNARCEHTLMNLIRQQEFTSVSAHLKSWIALLETSQKDIDSSTGRKDKSRALIRYEIHLRRAIGAVQEAKIKALVEQQDDFDSWLARAEEIRKRFVAMLFPK